MGAGKSSHEAQSKQRTGSLSEKLETVQGQMVIEPNFFLIFTNLLPVGIMKTYT